VFERRIGALGANEHVGEDRYALTYEGPRPAKRLFRQMTLLGAAFVIVVVAALWGGFWLSLRVQAGPMRQAREAAESFLPFLKAIQDTGDGGEIQLDPSPEATKELERIQRIAVHFRYLRIVGRGGQIIHQSGSTSTERTYEFVYPIRRPDGEVVAQARFGLDEHDLDRTGASARSSWVWPLIGMSAGVVAVALLAGILLSHMVKKYQTLNGQFERLDRLANLGTLAGGLAHEIRNPLNAMRLNLHMLRGSAPKEPTDSSEEKQILEDICREVTRLERLLTEFLTYARPESTDVKALTASEQLDELAGFLAPQLADRGVDVEKAYCPECPPIEMDPKLLRQALLNLVMNAVHAMPDGGTVRLGTETRDGRVLLTVSDTGGGVPEEVAEHVFEVFYSTTEGGSGLGLPIARRVVEDAGGTLQFETVPECGTTFTLNLPAFVPETHRRRTPRWLGIFRGFFKTSVADRDASEQADIVVETDEPHDANGGQSS